MNTMKRAWEIAKEAVVKFGGKAKEFLAGALKLAWAEVKNPAAVKTEVELPGDTRRTRTWMAKITGTCPTYKLKREFVNYNHLDQYGDKIFLLENGVYEFQNHKRRDFIEVLDGKMVFINLSQVMEAIA